jgi:hypothetical protein
VLAPNWICDDGTAISLIRMSTAHILNARAYLLSGTGPHGPMLRNECSGFTNAQWVRLFEAEILRRLRASPVLPSGCR